MADTRREGSGEGLRLTEGEVIVERPGEAVLRGCVFEWGEERLQLFWAVQTRDFT